MKRISGEPRTSLLEMSVCTVFLEGFCKEYKVAFEGNDVTKTQVFLGSEHELDCCLIFAAKRYIYSCKYKETLPRMIVFKQTVEQVKKMEMKIAHKNMDRWLQKWGKFELI